MKTDSVKNFQMKYKKNEAKKTSNNTETKTIGKKIIFISFIFFYASIFSQQQLKTDLNDKTTSFKLNSTSLIDNLSFPTVEIAIEKNLGKLYSIQFETGIQLYELSKELIDTTNIKNTGYRFRIEGRYYFKNNNFDKASTIKFSFFTGVNLLYRKNTYNTNYQYRKEIIANHNLIAYYINDNIGVKKSVYGANVLLGSKIFISDKYFIEPSFYVGLINRNIKNLDRDSQLQNDLNGKIFAKMFGDLEESSGVISNLSIALRLGLIL